MSIITGVLNGTNLNRDYHFSVPIGIILESGVQKGFANEIEITTNQADTGVCLIDATRDSVTPSEVFPVVVRVTSPQTIDTSGNGYIIVKLDDAKVNDGSSNAVDGSGIATIEKVSSLPSKNYIVLATLSSGIITDARSYAKIRDNSNGILDNIQSLINVSIGRGNWKKSARCATNTNIAIPTALNPGDTIDDIVLSEGDRVLVKDQTSKIENGIYEVSATPSRASDFDESSEITSASIAVDEGTVNADTVWLCISDSPSVGVDDIEFIPFPGTESATFIFNKTEISAIEDTDAILVGDSSDANEDKRISVLNFKNELREVAPIAGTSILASSADTERSKTDDNAYSKVKEIKIDESGVYTIEVDVKQSGGAISADNVQLRQNGVAFADIGTASTIYVLQATNRTIAADDIISIWYKTTNNVGGETIFVQNFRIKFDPNYVRIKGIVNLD